jgi:outer membrane PBP1 activator LpoA protein
VQPHHSYRLALASTVLLVIGALAGCASPTPSRGPGAAPVRDARPTERAGPPRVAVVLPESGQHLSAATALRDGIMAAYYARPVAERPELRFYPAPADAFGTVAVLQEAAQAGATVAIGPLDKAAVAEVAASPSLPLPVLALNQADTAARAPNLYQFALAPEDEAEQAAERAWADGHRSAAVITPVGAWGDRVHASFRARWQALGGQITAHEQYDAAPNDVGGAVANALGRDAGRQRHDELEQILGRRLEYAPGASAEAPCVFVAGTAPKVRDLRRELAQRAGAGIAVYGTSSAWTGDASPETEAGLVPIRVPDMPWLVADESQGPLGRATFAAAIPASAQSPLRRLYPMGIDSLDLVPHLERLRTPGQSFDGQTGNLTLDSQRRLHRRLVWIELGGRGMRVLGYDSSPTTRAAPAR